MHHIPIPLLSLGSASSCCLFPFNSAESTTHSIAAWSSLLDRSKDRTRTTMVYQSTACMRAGKIIKMHHQDACLSQEPLEGALLINSSITTPPLHAPPTTLPRDGNYNPSYRVRSTCTRARLRIAMRHCRRRPRSTTSSPLDTHYLWTAVISIAFSFLLPLHLLFARDNHCTYYLSPTA